MSTCRTHQGRRADDYRPRRRYPKARRYGWALYDTALTLVEKVVGPRRAATAMLRGNQTIPARERGRYPQADTLNLRALKVREQAPGQGHPDVVPGLNNLAILAHKRGRCALAERLYERALEIRAREPTQMRKDAPTILENYAVLLHETNRAVVACTLEEQARILREWQRNNEDEPQCPLVRVVAADGTVV